jgi:hypothetical protein
VSEDENFLARWSRRKREAEQAKPPAPAPADAVEAEQERVAADAPESEERARAAARDEPKFDLASLPPIDAIGPDTDIRPFLRPGVPSDLTRAALRRAWSVTPGIRDYIGPSENSWDFTSAGPDGVPGFDFGDPGVDVHRLAAELFGGNETPEPSPPVSTAARTEEAPAEKSGAVVSPEASVHDILRPEPGAPPAATAREPGQALTAPQQGAHAPEDVTSESKARARRHGGALPS